MAFYAVHFSSFVRNHTDRAHMYIPLYLIQHRHITDKKENTHEKACRHQGQGTATPNCVRLLLQNRACCLNVEPRAKLLPKRRRKKKERGKIPPGIGEAGGTCKASCRTQTLLPVWTKAIREESSAALLAEAQ